MEVLKKLKMKLLPYDPAIPVLGIYKNKKKVKTLTQKYICDPMFIATFYTIA